MTGRGAPLARAWRLALAGLMAAMVPPATASAEEILLLTNGRTLTVEGARLDGESILVSLPGRGDVRIARDLVADRFPDETSLARSLASRALERSLSGPQPQLDRSAIRALVDQVAARVGLDRRLAHAVVHIESNYQPLAISPKGAVGLMQIMPALVRQYGLEDPFDPIRNLEAGMRHLRRLLGRFDMQGALAAYNAGENAVTRYGGVPPYRETQDYVRRILAVLH